MQVLETLLTLAIEIYIFLIVVQVAISWLIAFDVINAENDKAKNLIGLLKKATDPVYKPIQKYVPPIGGIDVTPLIVIVALLILESVIESVF